MNLNKDGATSADADTGNGHGNAGTGNGHVYLLKQFTNYTTTNPLSVGYIYFLRYGLCLRRFPRQPS